PGLGVASEPHAERTRMTGRTILRTRGITSPPSPSTGGRWCACAPSSRRRVPEPQGRPPGPAADAEFTKESGDVRMCRCVREVEIVCNLLLAALGQQEAHETALHRHER